MTDTADSRTTADLVTGDHAAFAGIIQRHYPMVHALCTCALGNADLARDGTKEVAVTAVLGLARLHHDDRFGARLAHTVGTSTMVADICTGLAGA
jgi:DNA-directed RNA polymerase specialized sigma24 family protein